MGKLFTEIIQLVDARSLYSERYRASLNAHDQATADYWRSMVEWANRRVEMLLFELRGE